MSKYFKDSWRRGAGTAGTWKTPPGLSKKPAYSIRKVRDWVKTVLSLYKTQSRRDAPPSVKKKRERSVYKLRKESKKFFPKRSLRYFYLRGAGDQRKGKGKKIINERQVKGTYVQSTANYELEKKLDTRRTALPFHTVRVVWRVIIMFFSVF